MVRRVVTGHDKRGRSTIVSDASLVRVELAGVGDLFRVWSADEPATYPDAGLDPNIAGLVPPVGGIRLFVFTLKPNSVAVPELEVDAYPDRSGSAAPDADRNGLHRADTTDFQVILEGEATLETADGSKVALTRGDTVIHNGASHRWSNQGSVPAVLAGCMLGARRKKS